MLRLYFITVEEAYREWCGSTIYERRKCEDKKDTKMKVKAIITCPKKPLFYTDKFTQREIDYYKAGHTETGNTHMQQLRLQYPSQHHVVSNHSEALEECFSQGYGS